MTKDMSLIHADKAMHDWEKKEKAGQALERAQQREAASNDGILPVFYIHKLHACGYIAERWDGEWDVRVKEVATAEEVGRVRIVSPRVVYIRTRRNISGLELRDLIDFAYLPF